MNFDGPRPEALLGEGLSAPPAPPPTGPPGATGSWSSESVKFLPVLPAAAAALPAVEAGVQNMVRELRRRGTLAFTHTRRRADHAPGKAWEGTWSAGRGEHSAEGGGEALKLPAKGCSSCCWPRLRGSRLLALRAQEGGRRRVTGEARAERPPPSTSEGKNAPLGAKGVHLPPLFSSAAHPPPAPTAGSDPSLKTPGECTGAGKPTGEEAASLAKREAVGEGGGQGKRESTPPPPLTVLPTMA